MTRPGDDRLPRTVACKDGPVEIRHMVAADEGALLTFARLFPNHDLLFFRRDITQPAVIAQWVEDLRRGSLKTLLGVRDGAVVGCAIINPGEASWSPHVGELLVFTAPSMRGKSLGRQLVQEAFAQALSMGLEKIVTQMTVDQRGAIEVFEGLGFRGEALLRDHVKDRDGSKHDLVILSHDVARFQARLAAYGRLQVEDDS